MISETQKLQSLILHYERQLTYLSYKAGENNIVSKTWRTSLWVRNVGSPNPDDWKMRFHQGTPTASSEATAND